MYTQQPPFQFNYQKLKPKGWYTSYRDFVITPMSSNNVWNTNDIVRFLMTTNQGVMDPYRSYVQIQVQVPLNICPVGGLFVDNSAQNFFSQLIVSSTGIQLQRIQGYNFLAAYLNDINFSQYVCQNRQTQGLGFSNFVYNQNLGTTGGFANGSSYLAMTQYNAGQNTMTQDISMLNSPTRMKSWPKYGAQRIPGTCTVNPSSTNSNHISTTNWMWQGVNQDDNAQLWIANAQDCMNIRAQYKNFITDNKYPDSGTSCLQNTINVSSCQNSLNIPYTQLNLKNLGSYTTTATNIFSPWFYSAGKLNKVTLANSAYNLGYQSRYAPAFCKGSFQPLLSPTIPQCQMQNGQILPSKVPVYIKKFKIPLISSVLGLLIDPSQFLLIPMQALNNTLIQLTLNPFAMTSTGYSDVTQFDSVGMQNPIQRKFLITSIQYHIDLYLFFQKQGKAYILQALNKQIYVSSTCWTLGSQYQIPNGQLLSNAWPTSSTTQYMTQLMLMLISNDYQVFPFCRQQFRLSGNITSFQIRFNSQFFPQQPLLGNAGNPQILDNTGDNSVYLTQILKTTDYMFSTNYPHPRINKYNFAVNNRIYNPKNTNTFYPVAMFQDPTNISWMQNPGINGDTAMGCSYDHQQRFVGKGVYLYSWQPYGHSKGAIHGINANLARPFQVILNCNSTGSFTRDQTMYIFIKSAIIVKYSSSGISIIGK